MDLTVAPVTVPRIEHLRVRNYRVLRNVDLKSVSPLTVFVGPNGSGKSTLFDIFAFLSECFTEGLRRAWDRRGRFKELRSRNADGPILIELKYREPNRPLITYHLEIDETARGPVIGYERLQWRRREHGQPFKFLEFRHGEGVTVSGEEPDDRSERIQERLASPDVLAVNTLGQFEKHARVKALRDFITGWHLSYLSAQDPRGTPEAGPQEHLSRTGHNLANVIQYLGESNPDRLKKILDILSKRIPQLERVDAELLTDGRLLLQIKDAPFERPILARFASDGTLKMLAYLVLIYDPEPAPFIGIEEPENYLHPRLLPELVEECGLATNRTQLMMTTHSPFILNSLQPEQVRILHRGKDGYTIATRVADIQGIREMKEEGAALGDLWMEGYFGRGDPMGDKGN